MASISLRADSARLNRIPSRKRPRLRSDVPPFNAVNPTHLAAWAAIWDLGQADLRRDAGASVEAMITLLDVTGGDPDLEDGDVDCCAARDDHVGIPASYQFGAGDGYPGDPDDAEDLGEA